MQMIHEQINIDRYRDSDRDRDRDRLRGAYSRICLIFIFCCFSKYFVHDLFVNTKGSMTCSTTWNDEIHDSNFIISSSLVMNSSWWASEGGGKQAGPPRHQAPARVWCARPHPIRRASPDCPWAPPKTHPSISHRKEAPLRKRLNRPSYRSEKHFSSSFF